MKILVLGGCGIQGLTAISDLVRSKNVEAVLCADSQTKGLERLSKVIDLSEVESLTIDAADVESLIRLYQKVDTVIDMLPRQLTATVCQAALKTGVSVVNTNYGYHIADLDSAAQAAGITIMPECGLDPGIDLVIYGEAHRRFDEIHVINSYCGGMPEKNACDNPFNYKLSWTWEGVLSSCKRDSRSVKNGKIIEISGDQQHETDLVHEIDFPGLGKLEAIPNGDAVFFTDLLGVTDTITETGRYSLRWPGWSALWRPLKQLGFLSETPVDGLDGEVSPYRFMLKYLEPLLQYKDNEKDLVVMLNIFEGIADGKPTRMTTRMIIERDLETGLMAMSKGVGFPASIAAQMIAAGEITDRGVLTPMFDIPYQQFTERLADRGIVIEIEMERLD
ncbi:saccharopine dehydrogenase C-terminal domain-containing protein [Desulfococcaceae bacterium HSG9]|nr:saccharopine dehydrogenase C-terminal domain-containing protein [Desulfococcaceae bacterium HSG9]